MIGVTLRAAECADGVGSPAVGRSFVADPFSSDSCGMCGDMDTRGFNITICELADGNGPQPACPLVLEYVISNVALEASTPRCGIRSERKVDVVIVGAVPWGTAVSGVIIGDGWLQLVGRDGVVPEYVHGKRIVFLARVGILPRSSALLMMD